MVFTKGLGEEDEPDWVQFKSSDFVHRVLFGVDVQCFLDSPAVSYREHYDAGERVDLLDSYDFPSRTITETESKTWSSF